MALERIQKLLAQAGIASRRKAEDLIDAGLVTVNGKVVKLGDKAEWGKDAIKVEGKLILSKEPHVYYLFHKPKKVICSLKDPEGRPALGEYFVHVKERVYPIGRLDFMSEGAVLMTNDGDFAEKLQKSDQVLRIYHVKVKGSPDEEMLERLKHGLKKGRNKIVPHQIRVKERYEQKSLIEISFVGSMSADLKTFFEERGFLVERIVRDSIGHLSIEGLKPGEYKLLKASQAKSLLIQPELGIRKLTFETQKAEEKEKDQRIRKERYEKSLKNPPKVQIEVRGSRLKPKIKLKPRISRS